MLNLKWPQDFIGKIIQGDCLNVLKQFPDDSVEHVITSPPYNVGNGFYQKYRPRKGYAC